MNTALSALVEVDHVRQLYPKGSGESLLVLDDVSLSLRKDEIVSLLGRSGCGKSSLLRIIAGLMPASEGKVSIGNPTVVAASVLADITDHFRAKKKVAFKMKRRKGYHRTVGHRRKLTRIKITGISLGGKSSKPKNAAEVRLRAVWRHRSRRAAK